MKAILFPQLPPEGLDLGVPFNDLGQVRQRLNGPQDFVFPIIEKGSILSAPGRNPPPFAQYASPPIDPAELKHETPLPSPLVSDVLTSTAV